MRTALLATCLLLTTGAFLGLAAPASAGPSCGTPDEQINLVPTSIWYGSGGCFGLVVVWLPPQFCPAGDPIVDRPYLIVTASACHAGVLLQP